MALLFIGHLQRHPLQLSNPVWRFEDIDSCKYDVSGYLQQYHTNAGQSELVVGRDLRIHLHRTS